MSTAQDPATIRDLRRRWKPHKERLQALRSDHPTAIRFHRACSWLARIEADRSEPDLVLIYQWIAFNALYGRWDAAKREPVGDRQSWKEFLDRILALDVEQRVIGVLQTHKRLVLCLLEDEYLSRFFWEEPTPEQRGKARTARLRAQSRYVEGAWKLILDDLLERIYLLRCQLVHGAASLASQLNRRALQRCTMMLQHLLEAVLLVYIDHGADEDWGALCYPPMHAGPPTFRNAVRPTTMPTKN